MGSERDRADARTELLALHTDWNPWTAQRDGARSAFAQSLRKHLISAHDVPAGSAGKGVKELQAQHHEAHAQEGTKEGVGEAALGERDVHVDRFLPKMSVDADPGQTKVTGQSSAMHHSHPTTDGPSASHTHDVADGTSSHSHTADDPLNKAGVPLLATTPSNQPGDDKTTSSSAMDAMATPKGGKSGRPRGGMATPRALKMGDGDADDGGTGGSSDDDDADDRDSLSDGQFAAVWTNGNGEKQRKLPVHDAAHAKNAMSRFNQTKGMPADVKKRAARKVLSAAKKFGIKVGSDNPLHRVTAAEITPWMGLAELENYEVIETSEILRIDAADFAPFLNAGEGAPAECSTCDGNGKIRGGMKCPVCKGTGNKPQGGKIAAAEHVAEPQVIALDFGEGEGAFTLGEHRQPYLVTGHWNFPDSTIGRLDIERPDLESVVQHFKENARGQDLPICDIDHIDPAFRGAAVGWVKDLELREDPHPKTGGPWIEAILDLNPVGEQLKAADQFRYGSPTLLRNWEDPATGEVYPLIAAGVDVRTRNLTMSDGKPVEMNRSALAWTNKPRLKQLGRVAASEDGTQMVVLAVGDGAKPKPKAQPADDEDADSTASTPKKVEEHRIWHYSEETNPAKVAQALSLADTSAKDGDADGDDDGPTPPCRNQPSQGGSCPGYTRWPGDTDGDGLCLLATRGCNGYVAVGNGSSLGILPFNDPSAARSTQPMADDTEQTGQASEATPPDAAPPPAATAPVETPPAALAEADGQAAELKFGEAERRSLMQRVEAAEGAAAAAAEEAKRANARADLKELAEKQAAIVDKLGMCLRTGRITKAEHATFSEPTNIVKLAENEDFGFVLKALEDRPASFAVPLAEVGTGAAPNPDQVDSVRLAERTQEIIKQGVTDGRPVDAITAARKAARELAPAIRGGSR